MKLILSIILGIALIISPASAAEFIATVPIVWTDNSPRPDLSVPDTGDGDTSLIYHEYGVQRGGFNGWVGDELARIEKAHAIGDPSANFADVHMWTSPEKLERISKEKKDGKFVKIIKRLKNKKA